MSWEYVTLDQLGTISRGRSKHRPRNDPALFGGEYPFVQTADVKAAGLYLTEYSETYNQAGLEQSKLRPAGTLCITIAANIADTAILGIDACFPDSIMGFTPFAGKSNVRFVKYAFDILQRKCKSISQGTAQDNLSWEKLSTIKFPAPPISAQNKIAEILGAYDDLIENNQKQIKLLEEAAQRLYKEWFVDLRFPGHETTTITDGIPEGWRMRTVAEFGEVITGKTPSTTYALNYGGNIPFITIPDMHGKVYPLVTEKTLTVCGADTQRNKYIPPNSIMVSCIATVGLVCITAENCQTNQQINSVVLSDSQDLYFFYEAMLRITELLDGVGSNGAAMTNVNKSKFSNILVMCPPRPLIAKYHTICKPIFNQILALTRQVGYAQQARERLLPKLLNGELEVN